MVVCFDENIYIKSFDENGYYSLKSRKCKDFDGPNNFSILWNQLLILLDNNHIKDKDTLCEKFNCKIVTLYKNEILKRKNAFYCSHIFSLAFALPILIFISQWILYISLIAHEARTFDGQYCPNTSSIENKMMMGGIGIVYFVRSFFIWDNLYLSIGY